MKRTIRALGVFALLMLPAATASAGMMHCDAPQTKGVTTLVDITKGCFAPTVATVTAGATVRFTNSDPAPHNLVGHAISWGQAEPLSPGGEIEVTFDDVGLYPFACTLHPGMVGVIVVEDGAAEAAALVDDALDADEPSVAPGATSGLPGWMGRGLGWAGAGTVLLVVGWLGIRRRTPNDRVEPVGG